MDSSKYKINNKPNLNSSFIQGYYKLIHPEKYIGDPHQIIYRSSWEYKFCKYCDITEEIIKWSSEPNFPPFPIKYENPITKTLRNYYVDFYIKLKDQFDNEKDYIVEVKPNKDLKPPKPLTGNKTLKKIKSYNKGLETFIINKAKSIAAQDFAQKMNYEYMIVTEDFLNKK